MSAKTHSRNTAGRTKSSSVSESVRHEASGQRQSKKSRKAEAFVSVRAKRRVLFGVDAAGPLARFDLEFSTTRGRKISVEVDCQDLPKPSRVIEKTIAETGLFPADEADLTAQLSECRKTHVPTVNRTVICGWKRSSTVQAFVTPSRTFGPGRRRYQYASELDQGADRAGLGSVSGTLAEWRSEVGQYLEMSTTGRVLLGAALAAPLLEFAGLSESWIFLLAGRSTSGKSTLLNAAASFQGAPLPVNPATTDRRLDELAAKHSDMLFVLGDLSQVPAKDRRRLLHKLAMDVTSGGGRSVSRTVRRALPDLPFRTIGALSAEQTSAVIAAEAGVSPLAGETVRCFDLMPGRRGYFDVRGSKKLPPEVIASRLNRGCQEYYGSGLRAWINWLCSKDSDWLARRIDALTSDFLSFASTSSDLDDRGRRTARKFGLIYAALVLGRKAKITRLRRVRALKSVHCSFVQTVMQNPSPQAASLMLRAALAKPDATLKSFQGRQAMEAAMARNPNWLAIDTKHHSRPVIGLRPKAIRATLGSGIADAALSALEEQGVLFKKVGKERWQKKVGSEKVRLLELDRDWLIPTA